MKPFKIVAAFMISFMIVGCTQKPAEPADTLNKEEISGEILKNWDDFLSAFSAGDIEKAMSYFTDDYINMPSFETTQDYEETKEMFQGMIDNFSFDTNTYKQTEIFVHPDMAYQFGNINMVMISRTTGDTVINRNRSVSVWKKTEDGSWKLYRWIGQG